MMLQFFLRVLSLRHRHVRGFRGRVEDECEGFIGEYHMIRLVCFLFCQDECRCPTNSIRDISTLPYKYLNKLSQMHMDESQTTTSFKTPVLATSTSLSLWSNHEMKHHLSGSPSYLWMYFLRVDLQEAGAVGSCKGVVVNRSRVDYQRAWNAPLASTPPCTSCCCWAKPSGDIWKDEYYFFCDNNRSNNNDGAQAVMIHEDDFVSAMQSLQLKPLCITMLISLATSIQHSYLKTEALEVGPDSLP
ncbi:uncharacterized protein LOC121998790 isoform X2 [Zingiber officinale]|uniref:uncharacterized protein LOC121998790 isoform X2 n=1 Tax=Zingiber officinale TaxID=94328 RepID=UPI001C4D3D4E|nr:uncharacterized protein LOC121998790 isoform X2 [Zingiber officinale]